MVESLAQRFLPTDLPKNVAHEAKSSFKTSEGELRVRISDEWDQLSDNFVP